MVVPHIFRNGEPADAEEVNENFRALDESVNTRVSADGQRLGGALRHHEDGSDLVSTSELQAAIGLLSGMTASQFDTVEMTIQANPFVSGPSTATGRVDFPTEFDRLPFVTVQALDSADETGGGFGGVVDLSPESFVQVQVVRRNNRFFTWRASFMGTELAFDWLAVGEVTI